MTIRFLFDRPVEYIWFETPEGSKFWGDVTAVNYVGGDMEPSVGEDRVAGSALCKVSTGKERKYSAARIEDQMRVSTLGVEFGKMDKEFHEVLYKFAWAKATKVLGYMPDSSNPVEEGIHKRLQARESRRMKGAIQAARIKGAVRCIQCADPGRTRTTTYR